MANQTGPDLDIETIFIGTGLAAVIGPPLLARYVPAVQNFLLEKHILTAENILMPIGPGTGFDLPRVIIGVAALALLLTGAFYLIRRRARAAAEQKAAA